MLDKFQKHNVHHIFTSWWRSLIRAISNLLDIFVHSFPVYFNGFIFGPIYQSTVLQVNHRPLYNIDIFEYGAVVCRKFKKFTTFAPDRNNLLFSFKNLRLCNLFFNLFA